MDYCTALFVRRLLLAAQLILSLCTALFVRSAAMRWALVPTTTNKTFNTDSKVCELLVEAGEF